MIRKNKENLSPFLVLIGIVIVLFCVSCDFEVISNNKSIWFSNVLLSEVKANLGKAIRQYQIMMSDDDLSYEPAFHDHGEALLKNPVLIKTQSFLYPIYHWYDLPQEKLLPILRQFSGNLSQQNWIKITHSNGLDMYAYRIDLSSLADLKNLFQFLSTEKTYAFLLNLKEEQQEALLMSIKQNTLSQISKELAKAERLTNPKKSINSLIYWNFENKNALSLSDIFIKNKALNQMLSRLNLYTVIFAIDKSNQLYILNPSLKYLNSITTKKDISRLRHLQSPVLSMEKIMLLKRSDWMKLSAKYFVNEKSILRSLPIIAQKKTQETQSALLQQINIIKDKLYQIQLAKKKDAQKLKAAKNDIRVLKNIKQEADTLKQLYYIQNTIQQIQKQEDLLDELKSKVWHGKNHIHYLLPLRLLNDLSNLNIVLNEHIETLKTNQNKLNLLKRIRQLRKEIRHNQLKAFKAYAKESPTFAHVNIEQEHVKLKKLLQQAKKWDIPLRKNLKNLKKEIDAQKECLKKQKKTKTLLASLKKNQEHIKTIESSIRYTKEKLMGSSEKDTSIQSLLSRIKMEIQQKETKLKKKVDTLKNIPFDRIIHDPDFFINTYAKTIQEVERLAPHLASEIKTLTANKKELELKLEGLSKN